MYIDRIPKAAARAKAESSLCVGILAEATTNAFAKETSTGRLANALPSAVNFSFDVRAPCIQDYIFF